MGTPHPLLLVASDPRGQWVTVCQARKDTDGNGTIAASQDVAGTFSGDTFAPFFIQGSGAGEAIDEWVAHSPNGRYVTWIQDGALWLTDIESGKREQLDKLRADPRTDQGSFLGHRAVTFNPTSTRLLYLRKEGAMTTVVVRQLSTGNEQALQPSFEHLWRARFDPSGSQVLIQVVTEDTNKNKRLDLPYPFDPEPNSCRGPIARFNVWAYPGDRPTTFVAQLDAPQEPAKEAPHFVQGMGNGWLSRPKDGALTWIQEDGKDRILASERCDARVLHPDAESGQVVYACLGSKGKPKVFLSTRRGRIPLGLEITPFENDLRLPHSPRLVPLYPGALSRLFDLETGTVHRLKDRERVLFSHEDRVLVRRNEQWLLWRVGAGYLPLPGDVAPMRPVLRTPPVVFAPPLVIDLELGEVLGRYEGRPLALSTRGWLLLPERHSDDAVPIPQGPLRWRVPNPLSTSGEP